MAGYLLDGATPLQALCVCKECARVLGCASRTGCSHACVTNVMLNSCGLVRTPNVACIIRAGGVACAAGCDADPVVSSCLFFRVETARAGGVYPRNDFMCMLNCASGPDAGRNTTRAANVTLPAAGIFNPPYAINSGNRQV